MAVASTRPSAAKRGRHMKAYEMGDLKSDLTLRAVERPIPEPQFGQLLVKVHATGLNARDSMILRGQFGAKNADHIPLSDNVGEVAALGPGVTGFAIGERVTVTHYAHWLEGDWDAAYNGYDLGNNVDGFLAEYALAPANAVVKISNRLSDVEACTLSIAGLTAWRALAVEARPQPSEYVLTIGTGGVSVFGLQIAKMFESKVIITSSSDAKLSKMKDLGADLFVNYKTSANWAKEVMEITGGRGADVILNNVGYPELENCFIAAGNNARCIHIGASRAVTEMNPLQNFFMKDCSIKGIANGSRRMLSEFLKAADQNNLKPLVDRVFAFDQALEAVRYFESGAHSGKVVIKVAA